MVSASAFGDLQDPKQQICMLWPTGKPGVAPLAGDVFVFQYWPNTITDSDETTYTEKLIPGGSHPLQQWVGGGSRTLSFDAVFTQEIELTTDRSGDFAKGVTALNLIGLPSERYTVDVAAAIARLRRFLYPAYKSAPGSDVPNGILPPEKLSITMPGTNLGNGGDTINVLLRSMSINYESWFASGGIRVANVSLEFVEIVQNIGGEKSNIQFKDRNSDDWKKKANKYNYRVSDIPEGLGGGS